MSIKTPNVRLLQQTPGLAETLRIGPEHFEKRYGVRWDAENAPDLPDVVEQTLGMRPGASDQWGGYLTVDEAEGLVVGVCAFKGPPTEDGAVEIAYYTFAPYEGQGYAKGSARALISVALSSPDVRHVIAHTLPQKNPSTSVLRGVGMRFIGEVWDPEDGRVWRWQTDKEKS